MYFRLLVWVEISSFSLARFSLASDIGASFCFPVYKGTPKPCWFLPRVKVHDGRRQWQATPVLLPRKSHGWRSLVGCSPWGRYKSDATEWLHFHFSLSHNGEGNGNPLQCSCLENPRDRRAWWAAIYRVAQSRTRLKRLSSSSKVHEVLDGHTSQLLLTF